MRTVVPGSFTANGRRLKLITALAILVILVAGWAIYSHFHNSKPKTASAGSDLTISQLQNIKVSDATKEIASKNYKEAADSYAGAASNAFAQKNYQQAKSILEDCINKIPDQYVPWYIYDSLAMTAQQLHDSALEKSSLQVAITKANVLGSGADPATVSYMQSQLQGIK